MENPHQYQWCRTRQTAPCCLAHVRKQVLSATSLHSEISLHTSSSRTNWEVVHMSMLIMLIFFFLTIVNSSCITFYRLTVHYITVKTVDWSNRPWSVPILKINQLSENNVEKFNRDFTYNLNFSYFKSQHNDSTLLKCNYWRTISTANFGFVNTQYQYLDNMQRLNSSLLSSYTDAILSEGMATCLHGQKLSEKEENGSFSS